MAAFVIPSGAVTSGEPVAIADIASYGTLTITDQRSVRQYTPYGESPGFSDNTIVNAVAPTVKYMVAFKSLAGNVVRIWYFADQADATAELALIEAQVNPA